MNHKTNFKKYIPGLIFLAAILISRPILAGNPLKLAPANLKGKLIGLHAEYLEDKKNSLDITDVTSGEISAKFNPARKKSLHFGAGQPHSYWIRFEAINESNKNFEWFLELDYPLMDIVELYTFSNNTPRVNISGDRIPFNEREIMHRTSVFPISSSPGINTYYLRLETLGTFKIPLRAWTRNQLIEYIGYDNMLYGLYIGVLLIMIFYNLFIFISVRDISYLYISFLILSGAFYVATSWGQGFQYLWPNITWMANTPFLFITLFTIFLLLFVRSFLKTKERTPRIDTAFKTLIILAAAAIIIFFIIPYNHLQKLIRTTMIFYTAGSILMIATARIIQKKGNREGLFFLIAFFLVLFISSFQFIEMLYGILPPNAFILNSAKIGTISFVLLLSLGLADQIKTMRDRLHLLNKRLEEKMNDRLKLLQKAQNELIETAHQAGIAEHTRSTLHDVGNFLNNINFYTEEIRSILADSNIKSLAKANDLLQKNMDDLENFLLKDPKGKILPGYYLEAGKELEEEHRELDSKAEELINKANTILDIIEKQRQYALGLVITEELNIVSILNDTVALHDTEFTQLGIIINLDYTKQYKTIVPLQKTKTILIFSNILKNAIQSVSNSGKENKIVTIDIEKDIKTVSVIISDNGEGIPDDKIKNLFKKGFTTKQMGLGIGLHTCAKYIEEMGGTISAKSQGIGKGASFKITFPVKPA